MIDKIQKQLKSNESFLITKKENKFYLSNFTGSGGYLLITKEKSYLFLDGKYITQAKSQTSNIEIINIENIKFIDALEELLLTSHINTLLFESTHLTYDFYLQLKTLSVDLSPKSNIVEKIRIIKSDREIDLIKESCIIAETAILRGIKSFKLGMTEQELALNIEYNAKLLGAEAIDFIIVASGENGAQPHIRPTDKKILSTELVTIDFGIVYRGYHSDITRTFPIGGVSKKLKKIYNIVYKAQELGISLIKPGITTKYIDSRVRNFIEDQGFGDFFIHGLGHGIGINGHEEPFLNKNSETVLKKSMVITIEPGIYIKTLGGVRIEDTVVVTEDGALSLTTLNKEYKEVDIC